MDDGRGVFDWRGEAERAQLFEEALGCAFGARVFHFLRGWKFGDGSGEAEGGIEFDLVERRGGFGVVGFAVVTVVRGCRLARFAREVRAGYLEAVEEEAGTFGVDAVVGDEGEELGEGELDGGAIFEDGEGEGFEVRVGVAGDARIGRGAAAGLVVEAEALVAEAASRSGARRRGDGGIAGGAM